MAYEIEDDIMSFVFNQWLSGGRQDPVSGFYHAAGLLKTEGKTLLIVCEEGDTEYDEKKLKKNKDAVVFVDDMEKLTPSISMNWRLSTSRNAC